MNAQTIEIDSGAPAPERAPTGPRSTTDLLVDSVLDSLAPENDNGAKPADQPRPNRNAPEREEDDSEVEQPLPADLDGDDAEPETQGAEDADDEAAHDTRGSEDNPLTVKDLSDKHFIELKVDGERVKITMAELGAGYIREQTFNQRINKTKQMADEAHAALTKAKETQVQTREAVRNLLGDPDGLYEFLLKTPERENVLKAMAVRYAGLIRKFRDNPQEELAFQRQRDIERLNAEREHFEAQKRAEQEERHRKEMQHRAESIFRPGWEAGLRKAGFPEPTQALYEEVMLRCNQRVQSGNVVTTDDVTEFVVRAAKLLELPPKGAQNKPKPAPQPAPRQRTQTTRKNSWDDVPPQQRRKNPDYFLKDLNPRLFK